MTKWFSSVSYFINFPYRYSYSKKKSLIKYLQICGAYSNGLIEIGWCSPNLICIVVMICNCFDCFDYFSTVSVSALLLSRKVINFANLATIEYDDNYNITLLNTLICNLQTTMYYRNSRITGNNQKCYHRHWSEFVNFE